MRMVPPYLARRATVDEIFRVRWDVLRPNRPRSSAEFPGDEAPDSIHAGAFVIAGTGGDGAGGGGAGAVEVGPAIACATLHLNHWDGHPAWQLRGMGVVPAHQGKGVGQLLLAEIEELAVGAAPAGHPGGVRLFWCNARQEAVEFYLKQGWVLASDAFVVPDVGPHFKMTRVK